jgi:hypothetical protein
MPKKQRSLFLFLSYWIFSVFCILLKLEKNKRTLKCCGGSEYREESEQVPRTWNIPMKNARRMCWIWTLI